MYPLTLYPNSLKNRFLTASAVPQNFCSRSRLASRQWSLAPNKNSEGPPGQIPNPSGSLGKRVIGFVLSLILTLLTYFIVLYPSFFHLNLDTAIIAILISAVLQFIVQSVCFIHIWKEKKGERWNLFIFISTISIILVVIIGSLWIMSHLDCHMQCTPSG